ncbi:MAG: hypothetical protein HY368_01575 [Candidatus Aenigmarchaeota archaeon]|nr:hypothetical protein [Candidatus Aenigmarchaeota archaeon]
MNLNILFAVFMAVLLALSLFQTMQIAGVRNELKARLIGSSPTLTSGNSGSASSAGSSSGMVGGC